MHSVAEFTELIRVHPRARNRPRRRGSLLRECLRLVEHRFLMS